MIWTKTGPSFSAMIKRSAKPIARAHQTHRLHAPTRRTCGGHGLNELPAPLGEGMKQSGVRPLPESASGEW